MQTELFKGEYPITDRQIAFFREYGYLRCDNVLSEGEVELLRDAVDRASEERKGFARDLAPAEGEGQRRERILQMLNLWEVYPAVKAYLTGGRIGDIARRLSGSRSVRLYHDQALVKPPGPSAPSPWHQDQPYWPSKEPGMFSCWMALDDVTIERGCMQFIPGSHNWGEFPPMSFGGDGPQIRDLLTDDQKEAWKPVPVELRAGSCTFHHGLTFHFTNPNTTDRTRRALVAIFIPEGITYAGEEKMESPFIDSITSRKGEALSGGKFIEL